jgi:hypothetical protein
MSSGNYKRYSTAFMKMTSKVLLKHGKISGIIIYIPKEMATKTE